MKISIISTQASDWGGSELLLVSLVKEALSKSFTIQLVVNSANTQNKKIKELISKVDSTIILPREEVPTSLIKKGFQQIKKRIYPFSLKKINLFNPDVVLINQPNSTDASFHEIFYDFLQVTSIKYYLISHFNPEYNCYSYNDIIKLRQINKKAQKVFFVSNRNKERFEHQIASKIENSLTIANHPFIKAFNYQPFPDIEETVNFAAVARLECNFKGQDILIEILSSKKWKTRNWQLNLYGTGPDELYLKELSQYYKIEDKVNFCGQVNDINKVWQHNHILLMPSQGEGKPLALEEAVCCGRPAVVSDVAGNNEIIKNNINGFLASSFFTSSFDEALEHAWSLKHKWEEFGTIGHEALMKTLDLHPEKTILDLIKKDLFN